MERRHPQTGGRRVVGDTNTLSPVSREHSLVRFGKSSTERAAEPPCPRDWARWAYAVLQAALDWTLPRACAGCGATPLATSALCAPCRHRIPWCATGEAPALAPGLVARGAAGAWYEGAALTWLRRYKYPGTGLQGLHPGPALVAGELIEAALCALASDAHPSLETIEAVVPLPSPASRIRERGFHPAGHLAHVAAAALGRPVAPRALRAVALRPSQTGLSRSERRRNVAGAFAAGPRGVRGSSLLLVDDVVTTGATLESAAAALRRGGARRVLAICAAQARSLSDG